jgi:hypothetical protein
LVEISSNAGLQAEQATIKLNNAVAALTPRTPAQAQQAVDIRSTYTRLAAAVNGSDTAAAAAAADTLRKILTDAGYTPGTGESGTDLLADFRKAMAEAASDNDKLAKLNQAVATDMK